MSDFSRARKINEIEEFCNGYNCIDECCPAEDECTLCDGNFGFLIDELVDEAYNKILAKEVEKAESMYENDMVNHPSHYNREGAMECLEEMEAVFGIDEVMTFCKLNAWKYRYRAADKNGAEDIKKSDFYMRKFKELQEKQDKESIPWM